MQLPELGSVNFKICTKITGDSFPQCKILSTLSQKELFPCRFSAPPPPRLLVPSSLCSAFSHVCMNILHPQFLFLWQRGDASELSAHLAFQRRYITCCWAKLIPCSFPFAKHGPSWISPVVWVYESVLLTSLQMLLVPLSSNFLNSKLLPRPGAEHKGVVETSIQLKLRREQAVWWCSLTMGCARWEVRSSPCHRPAAYVRVDWIVMVFSAVVPSFGRLPPQ